MTPRTFPLIKSPSLYLEHAALHLNTPPFRPFWLTYRNHSARCPKSGVYAEVVYRKCGERCSDERQSHLDTSTTLICPIFSNTHTNWWMCVYRDVSPTSQIRAEVFFFCAWTEVLQRDFTRIESLSALSRPTQTNNLCSLELSSGLHRGKRLWPPLLLERQDCERPKPEGCPPSGDQSGPRTTGSLRRENR